MAKSSVALSRIPPATLRALEELGAHLAVARVRRKESLATRAKRIGVSIPTLQRLETGDPAVAMGIYATALWLIGRDGELAKLAAPEFDVGALELDVQEAVALGQSRARASLRSRSTRQAKKASTSSEPSA